MTDDELERALFALPLAEPPAGLRERILAVTVARPRFAAQAWEIWLVGTLSAIAVWLLCLGATSVPDLGGAISRAVSSGVDVLAAALSVNTVMWTALGMSFVIWISQLSLPQSRPTIADR